MIWVLGASGYIGQALVRELQTRRMDYQALSRKTFDYTDFRTLSSRLSRERPDLVIQAAGFTGRPNVDACETLRAETVEGNLTLTVTVAQACAAAGVRMGHLSSGCIFTGAKVRGEQGTWEIRDRLTDPDVQVRVIALLERKQHQRDVGLRVHQVHGHKGPVVQTAFGISPAGDARFGQQGLHSGGQCR